jgi:hypothetical protein
MLFDVEGKGRNEMDFVGRVEHGKIMMTNKRNVIVDNEFKLIRIDPNIWRL